MTQTLPSPVVAAAEALAAELAPDATALESGGVDRSVVDRLAAAGVLAVSGPAELGGLPMPEQRLVHEALAGASPDVWFVFFQHWAALRLLSSTDNQPLRDAHLADLASGRALGGVAWSNLRTARPSVFATRVPGGWSLSGPQPWCTGWDLGDLVCVGGLAQGTDEVVFGLVPSGTRGLESTGLLRLAAMGGTSTHAVRYDGLHLPDEAVIAVKPREAWAAADSAGNTNVQASTFGIALAALDLLEPAEAAAAQALRARVLDVRAQAYRLQDEVDPREQLDERLSLRASALLLALECCTALLASRGGRGMGLDDRAQLLLRAAAFQLVHSQAAHIRTATLDALVA